MNRPSTRTENCSPLTVNSTNPIWRPRYPLYFITFHFLSLLFLFTYKHFITFFIWIQQWNWLSFESCRLLTGETLSKVRWAHSIHFIIGYWNSWNAIRNDTFWYMKQSFWTLIFLTEAGYTLTSLKTGLKIPKNKF